MNFRNITKGIIIIFASLVVGSAVARVLPQTKLPNPTIAPPVIILYGCADDHRDDRRLVINLRINPADSGRARADYVGMHDDDERHAYFFNPSKGWMPWGGSMFEPNTIYRDGIQSNAIQLSIPEMNRILPPWNLYLGYGTLSDKDNGTVQQYMDSVAQAKAKFPDRNFNTVDPDHFRLSLVQKDMTENHKYQYVLRFDSPQLNQDCHRAGSGTVISGR